jgi:hypothetical protein
MPVKAEGVRGEIRVWRFVQVPVFRGIATSPDSIGCAFGFHAH